MDRLKELRKLYPQASVEPNPECKLCHGTGERIIGLMQSTFCPCIFTEIEYNNIVLGELSGMSNREK